MSPFNTRKKKSVGIFNFQFALKKIGIFVFCFYAIATNAQWTSQATAFPNSKRAISTIDIVNSNIVWASAYDGNNAGNYITEFTRTSNGGSTWIPGTIFTNLSNVSIANISAVSDSIAWACIYHSAQTISGGIWKTTDAGTNWTKQSSAAFTASSFPNFVYFWDANNGMAMGDPVADTFEIYTTTDGGTNWIQTANTGNQLSALSAEYGYTNTFSVAGGTLWFGTTQGRVFKTTDKGLTFTNSTPGNGVTDITAITFADADTGYACMRANNSKSWKIAKSTDGGSTWNALQNNSSFTNSTIFGDDITVVPNTGYLVSVGSDPAATGSSLSTDGGQTWYLMEDTSLAPARVSVRFKDASTGWSGGLNQDQFNGGIYKFSAGTIGFNEINTQKSSVAVFPNPANDIITIGLSGFKGKDTQFEIYSVTGQKVHQGSIKTLSPVYLQHVDISSLAPGAYFVVIKNSDEVITQKFIKE
jgi:photosystem II stability/assembly factor-like uncharacterized protein